VTTRPSVLARLLLRLRPLGDQRADVEADLYELFERRATERGVAYARRRFLGDVVSLWFSSQAVSANRPVTTPRATSGLGRDLGYALRLFRRQPGAVAMAVIGLAVGIGVCGAVFSVLNAVALRPFGIADPATAVRVFRTQTNGISTSWPYADYLQLHDRAKLITLEAWITERLTLDTESNAGPGPAVGVTFVSGGYFATLGGSAARGRLLATADDTPTASPVAVLSYMYWTRRFGADAAIVGRQVWLSGVPITIAGVADAEFTGPSEQPPALWLTLGAHGALFPAQASFSASSQKSVAVLGRLAPGATAAQAEAELTAMWTALSGTSTADGYTGARVVDIDQRFSGAGAERAGPGPLIAMAMVLGVVGLVLMLACGNVANLLLASASVRQHEIGIRFALGATRRRVIRQLLTESLVLAMSAGMLGLLLTVWMVPALGVFIGLPPTIDPRPDLRVYVFLLVTSTIAGVLAGLAPARAGTRTNLLGTIRGDAANDGRHAWSIRSRSVLVGIQAAASLLVLVLALVMARAASRAATVETGFAAAELLTMAPLSATAESGLERLGYDEARIQRFWDAVQERAAALPGVEATALALYPPFSGISMTGAGQRQGRLQIVFFNYTSADYFQTIGLRVVRGRGYTADDTRRGAPVAVISETAARDFWGADNPIGTRLDRIPGGEPTEIVIGVVSDAFVARLSQYQAAAVYRPLAKASAARLIVRAADPARHVRAVHDLTRDIDPTLRPTVSLIADGLAEERRIPATIATLAGVAAAIAVSLSLIGLVGVTAFTVARRRREVAVRMAIGATSGDVIRLLLRDGLRPVALGLTAGLLLAFLAGRLISGTIFGVRPTDPLSFGAAFIVLCGVAAVAVVIPTRRAALTDAATVLRQT
jgi:predicted permease